MVSVAEGRYVPDSPAVLGQRSGVVGTWFVYLALLFMAVAGPVFVVVDLVVGEGLGATTLIGGGVTLFMTPLAIYFTPFVGRVSCLAEDDLRVGTVLQALVDPADNVFTIVGR